MLVPSLWNVPDDYRAGQFVHGGVDEACATTTEAGLEAWCAWIRWNLPGPLGEHPFPKVATRDGAPVPVLIAQGADDEIIHCVPADGADPSDVPAPADCMNSALFDTLRDEAYCPSAVTGATCDCRCSVPTVRAARRRTCRSPDRSPRSATRRRRAT